MWPHMRSSWNLHNFHDWRHYFWLFVCSDLTILISSLLFVIEWRLSTLEWATSVYFRVFPKLPFITIIILLTGVCITSETIIVPIKRPQKQTVFQSTVRNAIFNVSSIMFITLSLVAERHSNELFSQTERGWLLFGSRHDVLTPLRLFMIIFNATSRTPKESLQIDHSFSSS
jgi:hypothetical protein